MKLNSYKLYSKICETNHNSPLHNYVYKYQDIFKQDIVDIYADASQGVVYLTNEEKIIKVTSSEIEYTISKYLHKYPSKYFPKVYMYNDLPFLNKHYGILKEIIPDMPKSIKKKYLELEKNLGEWYNHDFEGNNILVHELIEYAKESETFLEFLQDLEPQLVPLYKDLVEMFNYTEKHIKEDIILDIHEDNLGYKDGHLVLFDY